MRTHHSARPPSTRWAHPRLSVRYNLEWDPLRNDPPQWESGWVSFIRGLGQAKTWLTDQFSIGLYVVIVIAVVLTIAVLLGDSLVHALRVWLGR
jgi:hypothetical protein